YVSNRGHNSLAVFKVTHQGRVLDLVQTIGTAGDFPRDFNIDPSGQYIVVANQNTDNVTVFRRNQESGLLTKIQQDFPIPEGVRVMFY
ncbi:MAG: hypothetical protein Q611_LSC00120G0001, partial [Leuconostoc sp. DORA_2]